MIFQFDTFQNDTFQVEILEKKILLAIPAIPLSPSMPNVGKKGG
jgi:hypothetical protein